MVLLNIYNNQKQFLLHQPHYSPGGRKGVKTFILMKLEGGGEKKTQKLCFFSGERRMVEVSVEGAKSRV